MKRSFLSVAIFLLIALAPAFAAQTTITDNVNIAAGVSATSVTISWPAFTAADGTVVSASSTTVPVSATGAFTTTLYSNVGSGLFYTVTYNLPNGATKVDYWTVPTDTTPVTIAQLHLSKISVQNASSTSSGGGGGPATNGVPATGSGVVCDASGTPRICTPGTDYQAPPSLLSGAQAVYLLNEQSGTTAHDTSGNGYDCTFGTGSNAPTWTPQGISFAGLFYNMNGGNNGAPGQYLSCPQAALNGAQTVEIWYKPYPSTFTSGQPIMLDSGATGYSLGFSGGFQAIPQFINSYSTTVAPGDKLLDNSSFTFVAGSPAQFYVNGHAPLSALYSANFAGFTTSGAWTIGSRSGGSYSFTGQIYAIVLRSAALTASQAAQDDAGMKAMLLQRGLAFSNFVQAGSPLLVCAGDSICNGQGNGPGGWNQTLGEQASAMLNRGFQFYNYGQIGYTSEQVYAEETPTLTSLFNTFSGDTKILWFEAGTNSLHAGDAGSLVYVYANNECSQAQSLATACIVNTFLPRSDNTTGNETNRLSANGLYFSNYYAGSFNASAIAQFDLEPTLGNPANTGNSTYFVGGVHPTTLGYQQLAPYLALAIRSVTSAYEPFWLPIRIPALSMTLASGASTTGSINLYRLQKGQQVCGIKENVSSAYSGAGLSALTVTLGDSGGTATSYASALSMLTTGGQSSPQGYVSPNGIVQANFASTGANLSAVTTGAMTVDICVVTAP